MNDKCLTTMEVISLMILFMVGDSLVLPLGVEAKEYAWIVILIATVVTVPLMMIYSYILSNYPDKNYYEILEEVFGSVLGKILVVAYIIFLINLWALIIRNQANFIVTLTLYDTPIYVFIIVLMGLNLMAIHSGGLKVLCNVSKLFLIITMFFLAFVFFASIPNMTYEEFDALRTNFDIELIEKGVFSLISFPFTEVVVFILIITKAKCKRLKTVFITGSVVSGVALAVIVLAELLVLGAGMYESSYYPIHSITRKIKIGGILSRGEIVGLSIVVLGNVIKSSVVLYAALEGIVGFFKFENPYRVLHSLALFEMTWAATITNSTMEILTMAAIYPYFELQFGFIIPIITFIVIFVKRGRTIGENN